MSDVKIFAKTIDEKAMSQIKLLMEQKPFGDCKIRIMPDVHAGAGCVIGFTANLGDKVIPNIVGVDIGCGMYCCCLGNIEIDYDKLDSVIRKYVPSGMNVKDIYTPYNLIEDLRCYDQIKNKDWIHASLGTLGGGNHFIEIDEDNIGIKYLVIHSGSRNLGKQVADIYQLKAIRYCKSTKQEIRDLIAKMKEEGREKEIATAVQDYRLEHKCTIPNDLCYLEDQDRLDYLHDMMICQQFATDNREKIAETICRNMKWNVYADFHVRHNYIDADNIVRKGAISAHYGDIVLIPINMRDGCIIGRGLGNPDWNYSAPHGAGRIMSRTQARSELQLADYQKTMSDVYSTSVCLDTLDEAPQAYKPMEEIVDLIQGTVEIINVIKPTYNFKASEPMGVFSQKSVWALKTPEQIMEDIKNATEGNWDALREVYD